MAFIFWMKELSDYQRHGHQLKNIITAQNFHTSVWQMRWWRGTQYSCENHHKGS
jgi:hypothetical protein